MHKVAEIHNLHKKAYHIFWQIVIYLEQSREKIYVYIA